MKLKIQAKNNGTEDWPAQTKLYLVDYTKVSPFPDGKTFLDVGHCTAEDNRPEPLEIVAPSISGLHEFKFRYGIEGQGLFGEIFVV